MVALKVGITGGIGSGKTTVCRIFETLGIPVFSADDCAKRILVDDAEVVTEINELFGHEAYLEDGKLNRTFIASKIFNDKQLLQQMNQIVHPAVLKTYQLWHAGQTAPYTLNESALLFETGRYKQMDFNLLVTCPLETRIIRVMKRDQVTHEQVMRRIENQMPEDQKQNLADETIENGGSTLLIPQVVKIHHKLTKK